MLYLIDANNLAGELRILNEKDFDKLLIAIIKKWPASQKNKIFLVFDSADPMGDKYTTKNLTIVYTPKDNYYRSADDKIIEIAENETAGQEKKREELTVVSSDREIMQKINKINEGNNSKIKLLRSEAFAQKLYKKKPQAKPENGNRGLDNKTINNINQELLDLWQ